MTIRELIAELANYDLDAKVILKTKDDGEDCIPLGVLRGGQCDPTVVAGVAGFVWSPAVFLIPEGGA